MADPDLIDFDEFGDSDVLDVLPEGLPCLDCPDPGVCGLAGACEAAE